MTGNKLVPTNKPERNGRNYAFIDSRGEAPLTKEFREYLRDTLEVKKAYVFLEYGAAHSAKYSELKNAGYDLIFIQNSLGVELVLQAMIDYRNYTKAILCTGQGDIVPLIKYLLQHEKLKQLILPDKKSYAGLLQQQPLSADMITFMNDIHAKLATTKSTLKIQV